MSITPFPAVDPDRPARAALWLRAALALLLVLAVSGVAEARETRSEEIEKTFRLQPGGEVILENVNGNIEVEGWDRDRVELRVVKQVKASTAEAAEEGLRELKVTIDSDADRLHVEARKPEGLNGFAAWLRKGNVQYQASYELKVPRHVVLDATTVNGTVHLTRLNGDVDAHTVNGKVELTEVAGRVRTGTVNGSVVVDDARGSVSAETVNGRIRVAMLDVAPNADMEFSSVNGSVEVALPADVQTRLVAKSTNGGISTDFGVEVKGRHSRSVDADLNGGGDSRLEVSTTNGRIKIAQI